MSDRSRTPRRKITELSRRARQLDAAIVNAEQQGEFDLVLSNLHKTDRIVARSRSLKNRNVWFCLHGVFSTSYLGHRSGFDRWMKQQKIKRVYQGRNVITVSDAVGRDLVEQFAIRPAQLKLFITRSTFPLCAPPPMPTASSPRVIILFTSVGSTRETPRSPDRSLCAKRNQRAAGAAGSG